MNATNLDVFKFKHFHLFRIIQRPQCKFPKVPLKQQHHLQIKLLKIYSYPNIFVLYLKMKVCLNQVFAFQNPYSIIQCISNDILNIICVNCSQEMWLKMIKNKMNVFRRMTSDKATDSRVDKHPKRKVIDLHLWYHFESRLILHSHAE